MNQAKFQNTYIRIIVLAIGISLLAITGCMSDNIDEQSERAQQKKDSAANPTVKSEIGEASWYGPGFHGKKTASGEIFDQTKMTAAHPTLPLGTEAKVTNLENGEKVEVTINDRGPFVNDRVIDLSRAAAKKLDMQKEGTAEVKIETEPTTSKKNATN